MDWAGSGKGQVADTFWGNQPYSDKIFKIQKGWLELSKIHEWEIHVGNCSKN